MFVTTHIAATSRRMKLICMAALMLTISVGVGAAKPQPPRESPDFTLWLMRVQYTHRADAAPDAARIADLQAQADAAPTPAAKRKVQREIEKVQADADKHRAYMLYGWAVEADAAGKPLSTTRAMIGFILPASSENDKAMAALQQSNGRDAMAIHRANSRDLFTYSGRKWVQADRAAIVKNAAEVGDPPAFNVPPKDPVTEAQRNAIHTSLQHNRSTPRDTGGTLHRYTLKIACDHPPVGAASLNLWLAMKVAVDGKAIGPIIDHMDVPRSSNGTFGMSVSFEFITRPSVTMDAVATTATLIAVEWK